MISQKERKTGIILILYKLLKRYFEVFKNDKLYLQGLYENDVLLKGILYPVDHESIVSIEANKFEKNF